MDREKIIFLRNLFLRAFLIGVVFALIIFGATFALWNTWTAMVLHLFKVTEPELGRIMLLFFTLVRLILVFLFLVPALALHWAGRKG